MNTIKLNRRNIIAFLLLLLVPVFGFLYSVYNFILTKNRKTCYLIISFFFSIVTIKNPPIHDIYRYLLRFDNIKTLKDIGIYTNDYFFDFLVILFKLIDLPFYLIPSIFVFMSIFLILLSIDELIKYFNISTKKSLILIIFTLVLSNPITISLGLRSHLAFAFFLYGLVKILTKGNKKYYLFFIFAFLTHTSSSILILAFIFSLFFKPNKFYTVFLSVTAYIISNTLLTYIASTSIFSDNFSTLTTYTEFDNLSGKSQNGLIFYYLTTFVKITMIFSYIIFYKNNFQNLFSLENKFIAFINNTIILIFATSMSEIAFGRYSNYTVFFIVIFLMLNNKKYFLKIMLIIYFIFYLLINNIYVNRNTIKTSSIGSLSISSPLYLFLYSDLEYRKNLSNTDINGYPIKGPGSEQ